MTTNTSKEERKRTLRENNLGEWVEAEPEPYHSSWWEKLKCRLGFHWLIPTGEGFILECLRCKKQNL